MLSVLGVGDMVINVMLSVKALIEGKGLWERWTRGNLSMRKLVKPPMSVNESIRKINHISYPYQHRRKPFGEIHLKVC
jgi:hypothetical protein